MINYALDENIFTVLASKTTNARANYHYLHSILFHDQELMIEGEEEEEDGSIFD